MTDDAFQCCQPDLVVCALSQLGVILILGSTSGYLNAAGQDTMYTLTDFLFCGFYDLENLQWQATVLYVTKVYVDEYFADGY